jgi:hypothetical protein
MLNNDAERKIRALLERANHPSTPPQEAEVALAMAYRLMMKYDFDIRTLQASDAERSHSGRPQSGRSGSGSRASDAVERRRYETTGPYRVRRYFLRYGIAEVMSCTMFRATTEEDTDTVVCYAFGTASDLDAADTLYGAAELLALRTIPWGDRGYRTAWWHGFSAGLCDRLRRERRKLERNESGAALVWREREVRAGDEMRRFEPNLIWRTDRSRSAADAFADGKRAGARFSGGGRDVGGRSLSLPPGA